jgi:hypothetical protein
MLETLAPQEVLRKGDWIQTYRGHRFYPLDPRVEEIDPRDIAHALAHQVRFSGHVRGHYSVLEHSLRVAELVSPENKLYALLHDASEAYLKDVPRPLKQLPEFAFYREAEAELMRAVEQRFRLSPGMPEEVDRADKAMLWHEYQSLMHHHLPEFDHWEEYGRMCWKGAMRDWREQSPALHIRRWTAEVMSLVGPDVFYGRPAEYGVRV